MEYIVLLLSNNFVLVNIKNAKEKENIKYSNCKKNFYDFYWKLFIKYLYIYRFKKSTFLLLFKSGNTNFAVLIYLLSIEYIYKLLILTENSYN